MNVVIAKEKKPASNDTPDYEMMIKQLEGFMETENHYVATLSNASALIWDGLNGINWAGFYIVHGVQLVLGPFQGKTACIHIQKGKGVCGMAWENGEAIIVEDVSKFKGHIACDSRSKSEIVVPIKKDGEVVAVLDIDSPFIARFSDKDKEGLLAFVRKLEEKIEWA
ncbi:MAG: GAF domain-containing protein [Lachnospiraceae bacterium]|nr:GAF domain-containing protein [Lachnospiraceae bacterium]